MSKESTNEKVFLPKPSVFFCQSISRLRILLCSKTMYWQKKDFPYSRASHWFLLTKEWIQSLLRNFFSLSFLLTKEFKVYWKLFFIIYLKCQKHFTWKLNLWRFMLKFPSGFIFKFHHVDIRTQVVINVKIKILLKKMKNRLQITRLYVFLKLLQYNNIK